MPFLYRLRVLATICGRVGLGWGLATTSYLYGFVTSAGLAICFFLFRWLRSRRRAKNTPPPLIEAIPHVVRKKKRRIPWVKPPKRDSLSTKVKVSDVTEHSWGGTSTPIGRCLACQRAGHLVTEVRTRTGIDPYYSVEENP